MSKSNIASNSLNPLALVLMDIDTKMRSFVSKVSTKYNLPKKDVESMFNSLWMKEEQSSDVTSSRSGASTVSQLSGLKKDDLASRCKNLGYATSNKSKQQLVDMLAGKSEAPKKLQVPIKKNQYGNYEHPTYHFVFSSNGVIYGKQVGEKIHDLSKEDIITCKKESFRYELPTSLDTDFNEKKKPKDEEIVAAIIKKVKNNETGSDSDTDHDTDTEVVP